jgi:ACT domain-containing protein
VTEVGPDAEPETVAGEAEAEADVDASAVAEGDDERPETDGGDRPKPHTIRLELVDEPGQLLAALRPIAEGGGNLLSIFHERGNVTPRGRIPVEVDLECPPDRFDAIVEALRREGVNVISAGEERYGEELTLLLVGDVVETDLSDTLERIEGATAATLTDLTLSAPAGSSEASSARLRLLATPDRARATLDAVREVADEKGLRVVEPMPLPEGSA